MPSFFFNATATTEIYPLSLPGSLPISWGPDRRHVGDVPPEVIGGHQDLDALPARSEEHTPELQSRLHLVCRLFFLMLRPPPRSTLSPYPALFRSRGVLTVGTSGTSLPR